MTSANNNVIFEVVKIQKTLVLKDVNCSFNISCNKIKPYRDWSL